MHGRNPSEKTSLNTQQQPNYSTVPSQEKFHEDVREDIIAITAEEVKPNDSEYTSENNRTCFRITIYTLWGAFCIITSSPGAVLNLFSELHIPFMDLHNVDDLAEAFKKISLADVPTASISALASLSIHSTVSILYLGPALSHVKHLLIKAFNACRKNVGHETQDTLHFTEVVTILWSFCSAIPTSQIFKETFSFLGPNLSYIPFGMQLLNGFAVRCIGMDSFIASLNDDKQKFISRLFKDISTVKPTSHFVTYVDFNNPNVSERVSNALTEYLQTFYDEKNTFFLQANHFSPSNTQERLHTLASILGISSAILVSAPVLPLFMQKGVGGVENIIQTDIGRSANYQNTGSFLLGAFLVTPATIFGSKTAYDLPFQYIEIANTFYNLYQKGEYKKLAGYTALLMLTSYFSYAAAVGVRALMADMLQKGYLNYLGMTLNNFGGKAITELSVGSFMLYGLTATSKLIAQSMNKQSLESIDKIDFHTAISLITYHGRELDFSRLQQHPYFNTEINANASCNMQNCFNLFSSGIRERKSSHAQQSTQEKTNPHRQTL